MITGAVGDYRREPAAVALVQRRVAWRDDELGGVAGRRTHRDRVGEGGARGFRRQHDVNPKPRLTGDPAMPQARLAAAEAVANLGDDASGLAEDGIGPPWFSANGEAGPRPARRRGITSPHGERPHGQQTPTDP